MKKYRGAKTESWTTPIVYREWWEFWKPRCWMGKEVHRVYYEKAFDSMGVGILPGDKVKILSTGVIAQVKEIFQGDLNLGDSGYCYPQYTIKLSNQPLSKHK